jgi:urea transporter
MRILIPFLIITFVFCLIAVFLTGLAVGIGFLLAVCIPALQLGHAIMVGAVVGPATLYFFRRVMNALTDMSESEDENGILGDRPVVVLPKDFIYHFPGRSKTRKNRK